MSETDALPLSGPKRRAAVKRVAAITADLGIIRDPWIRRDLARERRQLQDALRWNPQRPTRSEHSLEGTAVNGLIPVGQEGPSE